jgi:adenylate cyclase
LPGSYGSYSQSPPLSPPAASNPLMNFGDHRRELSVLQTPQFGIRQNLTPSAASPTFGSMSSVATPALNGNIFDSNEPYSQSTLRPGTAPSSSSASHGLSESYFPDETRRPSVASVITNASSTGSKSSVGRSICKRIFGSGEISGDSAVSSDSSIPPTVTTPRTQYGFQGPGTPTSSRPRTPLPSAEVVPFLYQDLDVSFICTAGQLICMMFWFFVSHFLLTAVFGGYSTNWGCPRP